MCLVTTYESSFEIKILENVGRWVSLIQKVLTKILMLDLYEKFTTLVVNIGSLCVWKLVEYLSLFNKQ